MPQSRRLRTLTVVPSVFAMSAALAALTVASTAEASGFYTARMGGEHGTPTTDNPTAIYWNPAGLADRDPNVPDAPFEVHIFVDGNLAWHQESWTHKTSPTDSPVEADGQGANDGEAKLLNFVAAPMVGLNFKIKDFAIGAGFYVPFGGQGEFKKNDKFKNSTAYAGAVDGVQRWQVIDGDIKSVYISVGAAYDIVKRVSIGASFNLVNSDIKQNRARTADSSNNLDVEGRSFLDVSSWNGAFGVGVLGEIVPRKVWLGVSYQSEPGVSGGMVMKGDLHNNFTGTAVTQKVKVFQELPAVYMFGVRARPAQDWEIRFSARLTDWSVFDRQCITTDDNVDCQVKKDGSPAKASTAPLINIVRDWAPAFGARLGGSYWVKDNVELFASVGYDSAAVPSSTLEPALPDFQDISPTIGGHFYIGKHFGAEVSYTQFIDVPRDTTGKSATATYKPPSQTPDSGGKYTQAIGATNVNVEVIF